MTNLPLLPTLLLSLTCITCNNPKTSDPLTSDDLTTANSLETSSHTVETTFYKVDTLDQLPADLQHLVKAKVNRVFKVDFSGDGQADFICQYEPLDIADSADYHEDWILANKQVLKTERWWNVDIDYRWFANIDQDPEPEILSASGYEDGVDYAVYDHDMRTGKTRLLFYFHPIISEGGSYYWGYPWDIKDLVVKTESTGVYLQASLDHDIEDDENSTDQDSTTKIPAIFFSGHSTQPDMKVEGIQNIKWTTLSELK